MGNLFFIAPNYCICAITEYQTQLNECNQKDTTDRSLQSLCNRIVTANKNVKKCHKTHFLTKKHNKTLDKHGQML